MRSSWIATIVVVVVAAGIAAYWEDSVGSTVSSSRISTPSVQSSFLSSVSSSDSTTIQSSSASNGSRSTNQSSTIQQTSAAQYPLVWGSNPPSECDQGIVCINVTLGFSGQAATTNNTGSYDVTLSAFIQDAVTGQNATTPGTGGPVVQSGCYIQPVGFTNCTVYAPYSPGVPSGHPYRVTVFVTKNYLPCSLQKAGSLCSSQLLAPPSQTVTFSQ
jgi:hypothetical protein